MRKNNKGMSGIVATVLLIMLTIVLGAFLAKFVIPFVKNNLSKSSECLDYRDHFSFQESFRIKTGSIYKDYNYNCKMLGKY